MDPIEKGFLEVYRLMAVHQGMHDWITNIYGLVLLNPDTISLDEIARKTGYSLASVSNKVAMLESIGMLRKVRQPGSRKTFVTTEHDALTMWRDASVKKYAGFQEMKAKIPRLLKKFESKKLTEEQKAKVKRIQDFLQIIIVLDDVIKSSVDQLNRAIKEREK